MKSAAELREAAERYRKMAMTITDPQTIAALQELAAEYERRAEMLASMPASDQAGDEREP